MTELEQITINVKNIMDILNIEPSQDTKDTPLRVARAMISELSAKNERTYPKMTVFDATNHTMVKVTVDFSSWCEHHLLPFFGTVTIEYIPNKKILGLSKFKRLVDYLSHGIHTQEKLNYDILNELIKILNPLEVTVKIKATHTCMMCRGIKSNCLTETELKYKNE